MRRQTRRIALLLLALLPAGPLPAGIDAAKVQQAVDAAFEPAGMTAAFVVTWKGRIVAERIRREDMRVFSLSQARQLRWRETEGAA